MSELVAKWDRSYRFSDEELAAFIDLQSNQEQIDQEEQTKNDLIDTFSCWTASHAITDPDPIEVTPEIEHLSNQVEQVNLLENTLIQLITDTISLRERHGEVKSKSIVMQGMWDGLLRQQKTFEGFAERVEQQLVFYTQVSGLEDRLRVTDPMVDPLKEDFQKALEVAVDSAHQVLQKPEYKDAQVTSFRYKQLLLSSFAAFKTLYDRKITELNVFCREQDSPVDPEELKERYVLVAKEMRSLLDRLQDAVDLDNQLAHMLHDCLSKYLATRYNLSKRTQRSTVIEIETEVGAKQILKSALTNLKDEEMLFSEFFSQPEKHQRHFDYFCEQILVPLLERLRTSIDELNKDQLNELVSWIKSETLPSATPASGFGQKLFDLTLQYCTQKLAL